MTELGRRLAQLFLLRAVSPPPIVDSEQPSGQPRPIDEWRAELVRGRVEVIGKPGRYLDRSETGTGKSTADMDAVRHVNRALIVVPTHENAREVESAMRLVGLDAKKYPSRKADGDDINCWNPMADIAESHGLSAVAAVCPHCDHCRDCTRSGYLGQIAEVKTAQIAIATHARAIYTGIDELASGRGEYIALHEDAASVLCPDQVISPADLEAAVAVVGRTLNDPKHLNWLGQSDAMDDDGNRVPSEKLAERKNHIDAFIRHLADVIDFLISQLQSAEKTQAIEIHTAIKKAPGTDNLLFRVTGETDVSFTTGWRPILAAASGDLYSLGVIVDDKSNRKWIVANWRNFPSDESVAVFADATVARDDLEAYLGSPVVDITPQGHVERVKRAVQFPTDITRGKSRDIFLAIVRGVIAEFPDAERIGVITHSSHVDDLSQIGEPFGSRIVKSAYFGSGEDRASNDWHSQCDLIIVAGTPRVGQLTVQRRLIQFGDYRAAGQEPDWGDVHWRGRTESGQDVVVNNRGYRHPLWHKAHRSLVRAAIVQAAGRGRPILEGGCAVAIISTEECGYPLADQFCLRMASQSCVQTASFTQVELRVLTYLRDAPTLSAVCAKNISKRRPPITSFCPTAAIADLAGRSERQTRDILTKLKSRNLVARNGERGGWTLTALGRSLVGEAATTTSLETFDEQE